MVHIGNGWDEMLADTFLSQEYANIREFLKSEYENRRVYPDMHDIFNAFKYTPPDELKVVIIGQDPYHGEGQAHGLSFSVPEGVPKPPSLINIFKALEFDLGIPVPRNGTLTAWARRGVFLLNATLTVREGVPNSHGQCGWRWFTDTVIKKINALNRPIVHLLWGANAKLKMPFITNPKHLVLTACHPSPLAAGYGKFEECRHFGKANAFLKSGGVEPVDWWLE